MRQPLRQSLHIENLSANDILAIADELVDAGC